MTPRAFLPSYDLDNHNALPSTELDTAQSLNVAIRVPKIGLSNMFPSSRNLP